MKLPVSVACHNNQSAALTARKRSSPSVTLQRDTLNERQHEPEHLERDEGDPLASEGLADDAVPCDAVLPVSERMFERQPSGPVIWSRRVVQQASTTDLRVKEREEQHWHQK